MAFTRQHLIFDADDTLWENNIYFEDAFDQFCSYLAHSSMTPVEIRAVLDEIEIVNAKIHGYGSRNFARNLAECYEHLAERDISERDREAVMEFAHAILERPIELLEGVEDTIAELSQRHDLTLFTKGDPEEQKLKIDRSGLAGFFEHAAIVREKNAPAYRQLARERGFCLEHAWMIGNSPKSDINPALAAGLSAVYVPHPRTWRLEHEAVPDEHPRLLRVERIGELTRFF
ncbi:MAG: HAD family hydrolase [Acidobacteriaceae bacterium]|nr:HAD family hydrolase [Acidobacteriaceae bacterium]MBV9779624.1 HAD family hydrolase [Acidobacteriaceae bacterium]